jgi:hypothetical protein
VPDGTAMREKSTLLLLHGGRSRPFDQQAGVLDPGRYRPGRVPGSSVLPNAPERALAVIRDFIAR